MYSAISEYTCRLIYFRGASGQTLIPERVHVSFKHWIISISGIEVAVPNCVPYPIDFLLAISLGLDFRNVLYIFNINAKDRFCGFWKFDILFFFNFIFSSYVKLQCRITLDTSEDQENVSFFITLYVCTHLETYMDKEA